MKVLGTIVLLAVVAAGGFFGYQYWEESQSTQAQRVAEEVIDIGTDTVIDGVKTTGEVLDSTVGEAVRDAGDLVKQGPQAIKKEVTEAASEAVNSFVNWMNK